MFIYLFSFLTCIFLTIIIRFFNGPKNFFNFIFILEILFLIIGLIFNYTSLHYDLIFGPFFSICILFVSGCEIVIGIGILITYYRVSGRALVMFIKYLKG